MSKGSGTLVSSTNNKSEGFRLPIMQGLLPIKGSHVPLEIVAGLTLAIPTVMGYTKIAGTPVITGLYTINRLLQQHPESDDSTAKA